MRLWSDRAGAEVMLTRYAMGRVELVEKLPCWPEFSFFRVLKALTDSFLCIGAGGNVEQEYYIRVQGEEPSGRPVFWGKRPLFHRIRLKAIRKRL